MKETCSGLEHCCTMDKPCDSRNECLMKLGITPEEFLKIKKEAIKSFIDIANNKQKLFLLKDLPSNIGIWLYEDFLLEIKNKLLKDFKTYTAIAEKFNINRGTVFNYLNNDNSINIKTFLDFCKYIETQNIEYRTKTIKSISSRASKITRPNLPIKETPEIFNIIGHIISDGSATTGQHPSYINSDKTSILLFLEKLRMFGTIETNTIKRKKVKNFHKQVYNLYFPKVISDILSNLYKIDFNKDEIPQRLYNLPKQYAKEFIKSVFDDESTIIIKNTSCSIRCTMVDEMFVFGLKRLLLTKTSLKKNQLTLTKYYNKKYRKYYYNLWIVRKGVQVYAKEIGFDNLSKKNQLQLFIKLKGGKN